MTTEPAPLSAPDWDPHVDDRRAESAAGMRRWVPFPSWFERHPYATATGMAAGQVLCVILGALILRALAPSLSPLVASLIVTAVVAVGVVLFVAAGHWWWAVGLNRRRHWRRLPLLILPAVLAVVPLLGGLRSIAAGTVLVYVVGYALTALMEETWYRGAVLHVLAPVGPTAAVLTSAGLFGAAHLANVLFRPDVPLVVAQAVGALCFGVGYGALRLRTRTLWPLIVLHLATDLFARIGGWPTIPILVAQDVVLLCYGAYLLWTPSASRRASPAGRASTGSA